MVIKKPLKSMMTLMALISAIPALGQPLLDQFGRPGNLSEYAGEVAVGIVVPVRRIRLLKPWEAALRERIPELNILRVADVSDEKNAEYEKVAEQLKKRAPPEVSILVDMNGVWAERYGLDSKNPCLLVFDGSGQRTFTHCGREESEAVDALVAEIDIARSAVES